MLLTKEGNHLNSLDEIFMYKQLAIDRYLSAEIKHPVYDNPDYCFIIAIKVS